MTTRKHRVWIELERPTSDEEGDERAKLLSQMLHRLGSTLKEPVFWHPTKKMYCFTLDEAGGFVEAGDNGHWYNLDFFGRD